MTKGSIQQEDVTVANVYAPNSRVALFKTQVNES